MDKLAAAVNTKQIRTNVDKMFIVQFQKTFALHSNNFDSVQCNAHCTEMSHQSYKTIQSFTVKIAYIHTDVLASSMLVDCSSIYISILFIYDQRLHEFAGLPVKTRWDLHLQSTVQGSGPNHL